jgi:peptidyl-tRNA hydrolase ICT1
VGQIIILKYPSHFFPSQLHSIILEAAEQSIPSLPSEQQREHVKSLQRKEKARRKDQKTKRSSIKSGRNAKWDD